MRWKLLNEVLEIYPKCSAHAKAEFPSKDASWQTLVIEMMAQLGGLIVGVESDFSKDVIFAKIEKVVYYRDLSEAEVIDVHVSADQIGDDGGWVDGVILQRGNKICEAKMLLMNVGALNEKQVGSMTFHSQFMQHYSIREKVKI
jgi:hypothetical protein